jgi:uncharacterized protein YbaR (Trm112 family)
MIDKELLDILVCPACGEGSPVVPDTAGKALVCDRCGRRYPVRDGIPVMLVEEAEVPAGRTAGGPPGTRPDRSALAP